MMWFSLWLLLHYSGNSEGLTKLMKDLTMAGVEMMVSYDVLSLFTNTPIKDLCAVIHKIL